MADPGLIESTAFAIRQHESGGDYKAANPPGKWFPFPGAFGAYQYTPPTWTTQVGDFGGDINDWSPGHQDTIAKDRINQIYDTYHSTDPGVVAGIWYTGHYVQDGSVEDNSIPAGGNTISVATYKQQIRALANNPANQVVDVGAEGLTPKNAAAVAGATGGFIGDAIKASVEGLIGDPAKLAIRFLEIVFGGALVGAGLIMFIATLSPPLREAGRSVTSVGSLATGGIGSLIKGLV